VSSTIMARNEFPDDGLISDSGPVKALQDFQQSEHNYGQGQLPEGDPGTGSEAQSLPLSTLAPPPAKMSSWIQGAGHAHPQHPLGVFDAPENVRSHQIKPYELLQPFPSSDVELSRSRHSHDRGKNQGPYPWMCRHPSCTSPAYPGPTVFSLLSHLRNVHDVK